MLGNTIFNNTITFKSGFFERLMTPFIEELNLNDRKTGSKYMVQSLKAQINSLKIVMNDEYLKLINVTLYKEVISKHISPSVSQFVGNDCYQQTFVGNDYFKSGIRQKTKRKHS